MSNETSERIAAALATLGVDATFPLSHSLIREALQLVASAPSELNLKIATAALAEMGDAFSMFAPYVDTPKVAIFGSARTRASDPLYAQTREVGRLFADRGWMVITGAGPGIMEAGMEGAGRDMSIGVSIQLPFEAGANSVIAGDHKHVAMKYFFTRKLMLVKESAAFICMPGGFGTLDETFELLTLTQTGKGVPVPIVFLDGPGDDYWEQVDTFVQQQLIRRGLVSEHDTTLYKITTSVDEAVSEVCGFYANYHSARFVGGELIIRLQQPPTSEQLEELNQDFSHLVTSGKIRRVEAYDVERRQHDHPELPRIALTFNQHGYVALRSMIDRLNSFVS